MIRTIFSFAKFRVKGMRTVYKELGNGKRTFGRIFSKTIMYTQKICIVKLCVFKIKIYLRKQFCNFHRNIEPNTFLTLTREACSLKKK